MIKTPQLALAMAVFGALLLGMSLALPWAYVAGAAVGLDWVGFQAVVPAGLVAVAAVFAIKSPQRQRWAWISTPLAAFAAYSSIAMARALPTMAAVWAEADGSAGPAIVAVLGADLLFVMAAWAAHLGSRSNQPGPSAA
jgi:hypothetical protein